jgi:hypothetical protein
VGVCEVVSEVAKSLERTLREGATERQLLMLRLMQAAPIYREAKRLDAWDDACKVLIEDDPARITLLDRMLEATLDFAAINLYSKFSERAAREAYDGLGRILSEAHVHAPPDADLTKW